MKSKLGLLLLGVTALSTAKAQHFIGYNYSNYETVAGSVFNPANIANSRYKFDINIISANATFGNNAFQVKKSKMFNFNFDSFEEGKDYTKINNSDKKNLWANVDLLGPSFMVSIGSKNAIAFTSRFRFLANEKNLDNGIFQMIGQDNTNAIYGQTFKQDNLQVDAHGFADFGATYSRVLLQNEKHLLKAGITGKYVVGMAAGSSRVDGLRVNLKNEDVINQLEGSGTVLYNSGLDNLLADNSDFKWTDYTDNHGFGLDAGVVYEYRPQGATAYHEPAKGWLGNSFTAYKFRIAASVSDIGSIKYNPSANAASYTATINSTTYPLGVPTDAFNTVDGDDITSYLDGLEAKGLIKNNGKISSYKVNLPTMLHGNVDWHAYKGWFVNANADVNLLGDNKYGARYVTNFTVTPRFESKWLTAYSPVSYDVNKQFNWGFGLNAGVLFIGSGSILSNLCKSDIQNTDVHVGLHIPFFKGKKTAPAAVALPPAPVVVDTDGDGVPDSEDKCPTVPGLAKYQGCPIPDTDGDGVNDEEDKCPTVPGLAKYQGCPIPDSDGDGINDEEDKCPTIPGIAKYHGCPIPDTDGDGINDEEDKCPTIPGTRENQGCPEIKQEVKKKVELAARQIFFATGSDKLLAKSFTGLNQVAEVIKDEPGLLLDIQGHTDNTGSAQLNQTLSEKRAASVLKYLESKGVSADRMTSKGFGPSQPIGDNKTAVGRAANRRVELLLHY